MLRGEYFEGLARVEPEHLRLRGPGVLVAYGRGLVAVGARIVVAQDLHDIATAVPAVGRQVAFPKLVARRQGHAVELAVRFADALVASLEVLQIVLVAVLFPLVPFHGHLCGVDGVIVFGIKIIAVILSVDGLHLVVEVGPRFGAAVLVGE